MFIVNIVAMVLVIIGGLNWLIIGLTGYNIVSGITGSDGNVIAKIIYVLVGISAVWLLISIFVSGGTLAFMAIM